MDKSVQGVSDQYYQLSFLWSKDRGQVDRYRTTLRDVMASFGATFERQFLADRVIASGIEKPDCISLAHFPTLKAFIDCQHDARLRERARLRPAGLSAAMIEGRSVVGADRAWDPRERQYLIEIARGGSSDEPTYQRYLNFAQPVLDRYGYRVERALKPDFTSGLPFRAGVVKIASFNSTEGFARLEADPDYPELMKLYRAAMRDFMWVVGRLADWTVSPSRHFS